MKIRGIVPIKVDQWSELSSPCIWITPSIYIQVNEDSYSVVRDRYNDLTFYETPSSTDGVIETLNKAIEEGKPKP